MEDDLEVTIDDIRSFIETVQGLSLRNETTLSDKVHNFFPDSYDLVQQVLNEIT